MFKNALSALVALLILGSTAFAARCNPITVTGSYVRQINPYVDQLTLHVDGTAYWFNSSAFDLILFGTYNPQVGSWTCLADGTVLVTTLGSEYLQNSPSGDTPQPGQPLDINLSTNIRITRQLSVVDVDTMQTTAQVITRVQLGNDPLGPGAIGRSACKPTGNPCNQAPYKRIKPLLTDIANIP
jgi:hypothetical protein